MFELTIFKRFFLPGTTDAESQDSLLTLFKYLLHLSFNAFKYTIFIQLDLTVNDIEKIQSANISF